MWFGPLLTFPSCQFFFFFCTLFLSLLFYAAVHCFSFAPSLSFTFAPTLSLARSLSPSFLQLAQPLQIFFSKHMQQINHTYTHIHIHTHSHKNSNKRTNTPTIALNSTHTHTHITSLTHSVAQTFRDRHIPEVVARRRQLPVDWWGHCLSTAPARRHLRITQCLLVIHGCATAAFNTQWNPERLRFLMKGFYIYFTRKSHLSSRRPVK